MEKMHARYNLNIYDNKKEIRIWEEFKVNSNKNRQTVRHALITAMDLYNRYSAKKEKKND